MAVAAETVAAIVLTIAAITNIVLSVLAWRAFKIIPKREASLRSNRS